MTESKPRITWPTAIGEAVRKKQLPAPSAKNMGMGSLYYRGNLPDRFVTFKRPLVPGDKLVHVGIRMGIWIEKGDLPELIAAFREPPTPTPERVEAVLSILQGWLFEGWTKEDAKNYVSEHCQSEVGV